MVIAAVRSAWTRFGRDAAGLARRAGAWLRRDHRRRRLVRLVALVVHAGDRRRQRLAERQVPLVRRSRAELVEQLQDARAPLGGVVEMRRAGPGCA